MAKFDLESLSIEELAALRERAGDKLMEKVEARRAELEAELRTALAPSVRAAAGLPDEHEAAILLRAIEPTLLAA